MSLRQLKGLLECKQPILLLIYHCHKSWHILVTTQINSLLGIRMHILASRQCTCHMRVQVRCAWHMLCLLQAGLGEAVWCQQYLSCDGPAVPSSPASISIAKECCHPPIYLSQAYLNVSDRMTHIIMAYTIIMVCNNIPHDITECDTPCMYVCTYVLSENRSSIQSLTLMRSAISVALMCCDITCKRVTGSPHLIFMPSQGEIHTLHYCSSECMMTSWLLEH